MIDHFLIITFVITFMSLLGMFSHRIMFVIGVMFLVGTKPKSIKWTSVKHEIATHTEPDINKVLKMRHISF